MNWKTLQQLPLWQELRANRRLQIGLLAIGIILSIEGCMRWKAHIERQEKSLIELRGQKLRLQGQSRDKNQLKLLLQKTEQASETAKTRMWVVPSEAVGQARQKDWLQSRFQANNIMPQNITLATPQAFGGSAEKTAAPAFSENRYGAPDSRPQEPAGGLKEFRATVIFSFSPDNLEKTLGALEGGEPFARIESLLVNRVNRRVEMNLGMLMEVDPALLQEAQSKTKPPSETKDRAEPTADLKTLEIENAVKTVINNENRAAGGRP